MKTPQEKKNDSLRKNLLFLKNRVLSALNFHQIEIWEHFYSYCPAKGISHSGKITHADVIAYFNEASKALEASILADSNLVYTGEQKTVLSGGNNIQAIPKPSTVDSSPKPAMLQQLRKIDDTIAETAPTELVSKVVAEVYNEENNYQWTDSPNQSPELSLLWFQKKAASEIKRKIEEGKHGILLIGGAGIGKTFIMGAVHRWLLDNEWHEGKTFSHIPYLVITKSTVVEQQRRVFKKYFNIDPSLETEVTNIETLRCSAGQQWIKTETKISDGEEVTTYLWKKNINPCVLSFDESQGARREGAIQSKIMCAYTRLNNSLMISYSATPFLRVSEAKCFAVSTRAPLDSLGMQGSILNEATWPTFAKIMAGNESNPDDHNEAAIERLVNFLSDYIIRVKGVRPQFIAKNKVEIIRFETDSDRKRYELAYENFLTKRAKKEASGAAPGAYSIWTELLMFQMAAEEIRAPYIAKRMFATWQKGRAAVCACKFKKTIILIVMELEKLGINRDKISLIWGGGQTQLTEKQKAKNRLKDNAKKLEDAGIDIKELFEETGLNEVEDRVLLELPEHLRLGTQDKTERQKEIDKFQSGKSEFCCYTFRAGGVGLSLHHSDELTVQKVKKKKKSGYAVESDIPSIPIRQRETFLAPTYSAIELVQGLYRVPRITSLSNTEQTILFYAGTIEESMSYIVSAKLRCLSKVTKMKETWEDVVMGNKSADDIVATTKNTKDDEEGVLVDEGESNDEE